MLQLPGGNESQQVMLQVRFAEVNRIGAEGARDQLQREPRGLGRPSDHRAVLAANR